VSAETVPIGTPDLPQVIVGACGCVLRADSLPVGFRFVSTPTGDKRQGVYACPAHSHLTPLTSSPPVVKAPKPKRAGPLSRTKTWRRTLPNGPFQKDRPGKAPDVTPQNPEIRSHS
jgi:hypothetical protein